MSKTNPDYFHELAHLVVSEMPDSVKERRRRLTLLVHTIPPEEPVMTEVRTMLAALDQHEIAQREFLFSVSGKAKR